MTVVLVLVLLMPGTADRGSQAHPLPPIQFGIPQDEAEIPVPKARVDATSAGVTVSCNGGVRYPYVASIHKSGSHHCTGVLLKPQVVLTAAHCVDPRWFRASDLTVKFFCLWGYPEDEDVIGVSKLKMHPKYRGQAGGFNLALLKLDFPSHAQEIWFRDTDNSKLVPDETLKSLGWGRTSSSSPFSSQLQGTSLRVWSQEACSKAMGRSIHFNEFCSGGDGQGPCPGDDGGPILREGSDSESDTLIGIATSELGCGEQDIPDIFTRISDHKSWLVSEMDKL